MSNNKPTNPQDCGNNEVTNELHKCPFCFGGNVYSSHHQDFMLNTGEHHNHSMKTHDANSPSGCTDCGWRGIKSETEFDSQHTNDS